MTNGVHPPAELAQAGDGPLVSAPASWRTIDFLSDLHLHVGDPQTFKAWQHYMQDTPAQAVFILGDLFEVWIGDDAASPANAQAPGASFEQRCAAVLERCAALRKVFFMRGNRDFLVGEAFLGACGVRLLDDPARLDFAGQRWLLSHGDALCLDDTDYMQFRAQVRSPAWQQQFLSQPLAQRAVIARDLRTRSEAVQRAQPTRFDVDAKAAADWLEAAHATCLIHGHTHRPADHALRENLRRIVLSDWDLCASPARAQVLRITRGDEAEARVQRIDLAST